MIGGGDSDGLGTPMDEPTFSDGDTIVDSKSPLELAGVSRRSEAEVESMVAETLVILRPLARKIARQVGPRAEVDELFSVGQVALLLAARDHDPERSPFPAHATKRVKWAMLDSLRSQHGRAAARRSEALAALERLTEAAQEPAPDSAPESEQSYQDRLRRALATEATALFVGLTAPAAHEEESSDLAGGPEVALIRKRARGALDAAMKKLPERQRQIIERHYLAGERFDRIALSLRVSKSWLSRLHAQALDALAVALAEH